jgi:putative ABC transport system ATP-binding protein
MVPVIDVHKLRKVYDVDGVKTVALSDATFQVMPGEFVAIMGPSGSGKSTMMQILGLLDRATSGRYLLNGKKTEGLSDDQLAHLRNRELGFVFQAFYLLPRTTVYQNVELPLLYSDVPADERQKRVLAALNSVFLEHRIDHYSNQLSGGEKQRVAIARALVTNPTLIFADEPTGNLDSKSGQQVMRILQKLNNEGKTIILVTHETDTANHGTRILRMKDGLIVEDSPIKERTIAEDGTDLRK